MRYETVIYDEAEGIATLTFNRPHAMNAANYQMMDEMRDALEEAARDDRVRVLVVTGAGRGFHAGDDVRGIFLAGDRAERRFERSLAQLKGTQMVPNLLEFNKPCIAAVNGAAVGLGLDIALSCDIRVASENAKFGYFYVLRGIIGSAVGPTMLVHLLGASRALEMMLSGELIDAGEAERLRLVSKVVPEDRLMGEAIELAHKLMKAAPLAQQAIKRSVHKAILDPSGLAGFMAHMQQILFETEDHVEGAKAFAEKRDPVYRGR